MVRDVQALSLHTWLYMVHILAQARVFTQDAEPWIRDCAQVGIVSREYRMPSVVGAAVLKDDMLLTVDGSRGDVRIDSRV
jgi:phosphohistidine swiveling domain-containing protein